MKMPKSTIVSLGLLILAFLLFLIVYGMSITGYYVVIPQFEDAVLVPSVLIFGALNLAALIAGIIGLVESKQYKLKGRRIAITVIAISLPVVLIYTYLFFAIRNADWDLGINNNHQNHVRT